MCLPIVIELWKNALLLEEDDDGELELAYYMGYLHAGVSSLPWPIQQTVVNQNFWPTVRSRFTKRDIGRQQTGLGIPPVVLLPNSSLVQGKHRCF